MTRQLEGKTMNGKTTIEPNYGTTILRVALGAVVLFHGLMKVFVFTIPGTMGFFESVGFPGFLALPVVVAELVGGAMLVLGIWSRWSALAMVPVLLGATQVHFGNGANFSNANGGWEYPAFLAVTALALAFYGDDGRLSLAGWQRKHRGATGERPVAEAVT
jgi:putative oxidoreductase